MAGDLLRHSDPDWVRRLASGMRWLNAAIVLGLCVLIAGVPLRAIIGWRVVSFGFVLLAGGCALIGAWRVTAPDPAEQRRGWFNVRQAVRALMAAAVMLELLRRLPFAVPWGGGGRALLALTTLVWLVGLHAFFRHMRSLALRMPDHKLAAETTVVLWGVTISCLMLTGITFAAIAPGSLPEPFHWLFALSCTVLLGCVFFAIWALGLISRYAHALKPVALASSAIAEYDDYKATAAAARDDVS